MAQFGNWPSLAVINDAVMRELGRIQQQAGQVPQLSLLDRPVQPTPPPRRQGLYAAPPQAAPAAPPVPPPPLQPAPSGIEALGLGPAPNYDDAFARLFGAQPLPRQGRGARRLRQGYETFIDQPIRGAGRLAANLIRDAGFPPGPQPRSIAELPRQQMDPRVAAMMANEPQGIDALVDAMQPPFPQATEAFRTEKEVKDELKKAREEQAKEAKKEADRTLPKEEAKEVKKEIDRITKAEPEKPSYRDVRDELIGDLPKEAGAYSEAPITAPDPKKHPYEGGPYAHHNPPLDERMAMAAQGAQQANPLQAAAANPQAMAAQIQTLRGGAPGMVAMGGGGGGAGTWDGMGSGRGAAAGGRRGTIDDIPGEAWYQDTYEAMPGWMTNPTMAMMKPGLAGLGKDPRANQLFSIMSNNWLRGANKMPPSDVRAENAARTQAIGGLLRAQEAAAAGLQQEGMRQAGYDRRSAAEQEALDRRHEDTMKARENAVNVQHGQNIIDLMTRSDKVHNAEDGLSAYALATKMNEDTREALAKIIGPEADDQVQWGKDSGGKAIQVSRGFRKTLVSGELHEAVENSGGWFAGDSPQRKVGAMVDTIIAFQQSGKDIDSAGLNEAIQGVIRAHPDTLPELAKLHRKSYGEGRKLEGYDDVEIGKVLKAYNGLPAAAKKYVPPGKVPSTPGPYGTPSFMKAMP